LFRDAAFVECCFKGFNERIGIFLKEEFAVAADAAGGAPHHIAQGQLDHPLPVEGVDEVGQVRRAFEQMRISLHARLEELNQLLLVSQGVASSLEMEGAVQPILEAVLASGASAVSVLTEGRNRQVRRMVDAVGSKVLKLVRVAIGPIRIGDLQIGKWRPLTEAEVRALAPPIPAGSRRHSDPQRSQPRCSR